MQELEKILKELNRRINEYVDHDYVRGSGDVVKGLSIAKSIIRKHMNDGWIPVDKYGLPKDEGVYDLTIMDGRGIYDSVRWQFLEGTHLSGTQYYVDGAHYWADNYRGDPINKFLSERVIAWRKKPEPYRPERSEGK